MSFPAMSSFARESSRRRTWSVLFLMGLVLLFVIIPFLFWHRTWFGRPLTDQEMEQYLTDRRQPRKTQHALAQIAERILRGDPSVRRWYPQVQALADHPVAELRVTLAWVMGQDPRSEEFHNTLLRLLEDQDVMVRWNSALSLVRFGDARGRPELLSMLRPYRVHAAHAGRIRYRLKLGDTVNPGTLIARVQAGDNARFEIRSPVAGRVEAWLVEEGTTLQVGDEVVVLAPWANQVWEALRALYLVGRPEDLWEVELIARGVPGMPEKIQRQALLTAQSIRTRSSLTK